MKSTKELDKIRGWLPKTSNVTYVHKPPKPRWKRPVWLAFTIILVIIFALFVYRGAETLIYFTNPKADVTAAYFEKNFNCTIAEAGDVIEVRVRVYWHGHVVPEFKRKVEVVDPYPENSFQLIDGNNSIQYNDYGGGRQITYLLKAFDNNAETNKLPDPILYLDGTQILMSKISK